VGSQEERWHLQILDKGRVSCPTCKAVVRKTVEGLKKHMAKCKMPTLEDANGLDNQAIKDKLRKVLKRMGKLKCTNESCTASFTSIMGFLYHMKKCGKEASELEKLILNCQHCGKTYKSKTGLDYHLKSEHTPEPLNSEEDDLKKPGETIQERTASGRVKRRSAQVAGYHLQEIATEELSKEWPKRKVQQDLVPDERKLKYARPGLPAFSQEELRKWKSEIKIHRKVHCPNQLKYARPGLPAFSAEVLRKWKSEVKIHRKVHCPNQIPQMPRLGLLAASFSNGKIAVFSLPHPESLTAYKKYQSKGTVALWNLTTKSLLQRVCQTNGSVTLYPYHSFIAHDHAVRVVTWCKASSDFILTASEDRKLKFWDLRRTYEPVNVIKRYLSTEVSWQLHWCGISVAQENCYVTFGLNGIHYIDAGYIGYKPYFVAPRRGTVWSISGSDWLNTCTTGDSTGEVIMMLLADMTANPSNIKRPSDRRFPVYRTELVHFDAAASRPSDAEGSTETTDRTPVCEPRTYSEAMKKFYLLFEDTDLVSERLFVLCEKFLYGFTQPSILSFDMDRVKKCKKSFKNAAKRESMKQMFATEAKGSLSPDRMPLDSIHKVRFNPNLDAHGWLLSGGQSGIVRAHCLRGLNSPITSKFIRESQAQFNAMYQPQGAIASEAIMKTVTHSMETIVEVL
ncbi:UNVERIFIED_CONTAM: hypothetical protein FKN15_037580, partial [Acipenser sinensis]